LQQFIEKTAVLWGKDEVLSMKSAKILIITVLGALTVSVAASSGQTLSLAGGTLEGSLTNQTLMNSGTGANNGTVSSWVYSDSSIDSHGYIFIYQLENQGPDEITGANFNNFSSSQFISSVLCSNVFVGNDSLPGSLAPNISDYPNFTFETVTGGGAASYALISPDSGLNVGTATWFVVIDTDVTSFNTGYALTQDDFQAHGDILAPNFATFGVPEPSSAVMLLAGFACFYGILRCRRSIE
jgi:hypothetical protein